MLRSKAMVKPRTDSATPSLAVSGARPLGRRGRLKLSKEKPAEYGAIEVRKIELGYMSEDLAEISKGLSEDELVVVEAQEEFKDKARVEIAEVQEGVL